MHLRTDSRNYVDDKRLPFINKNVLFEKQTLRIGKIWKKIWYDFRGNLFESVGQYFGLNFSVIPLQKRKYP